MAVSHGSRLIVGRRESGTQKVAHNEVEVFDVATKTWTNWPSLGRGRHGSGFAILGDYVYTASGSGNRGGGPELTTIERLKLPLTATMQLSNRLPSNGIQRRFPFTDRKHPSRQTQIRSRTIDCCHIRAREVSYTVRGFYAADG